MSIDYTNSPNIAREAQARTRNPDLVTYYSFVERLYHAVDLFVQDKRDLMKVVLGQALNHSAHLPKTSDVLAKRCPLVYGSLEELRQVADRVASEELKVDDARAIREDLRVKLNHQVKK